MSEIRNAIKVISAITPQATATTANTEATEFTPIHSNIPAIIARVDGHLLRVVVRADEMNLHL